MTKLFLVRHGETDTVASSLAGSKSGIPLNENGKRQVEKLARWLNGFPISAVYSSPVERAFETASLIARRLKHEPHPVHEFGEWHCGQWEGLSFGELEMREDWLRFHRYRSGVRAPGGELMVELQARVAGKIEALVRLHEEQAIAIVSHAEPIRVALAHFLGIALDLALRIEVSVASVSVIECHDAGPRVLCINAAGELMP